MFDVKKTPGNAGWWKAGGRHLDLGTFLLLLQYRSHLHSSGLRECEAIGIIIQPAGDYPSGCYERIGHCKVKYRTLHSDTITMLEIVQDYAELQTIELV
jgi:hypothetical protein